MPDEPSISVPRQDNVGPELGARPLAAQAARETVRNSLDHLKHKREESVDGKKRSDEDKTKPEHRKDREEEAELEEGLEESFPASDPPASTNPTR
ncbi:MAG: hypothetical protein AB7O39_11445 [Flavobacteriaceae bacterium]